MIFAGYVVLLFAACSGLDPVHADVGYSRRREHHGQAGQT